MFGDVNVMIPLFARDERELKFSHVTMKLKKEVRVNFASTQDFAGFSGHATSMVLTHPLQVVRIVSASFKLAGVP